MKRRSLLAASGALAVLAVMTVIGPAAHSAPKPGPAPTTTTPTSTAPAPAAAARNGSHGLTRTERAVLLVTLTFLVGAGLLGPADTDDDAPSRRPAITLYDDPATAGRAPPARRPTGEPPPLR